MEAPVLFIPNFIEAAEASLMFQSLWDELDWERREGAPRQEYWTNKFNQSYTYGRLAGIRTYESRPDHDVIEHVSNLIDVAWQDHKSDILADLRYEGCFLNGYRDHEDSLGWHADDDPGIDHTRPIAIVSLYDQVNAAPRAIHFKRVIQEGTQDTKPIFGPTEELFLPNGSLALMLPGMQSTHQHKIPRGNMPARGKSSPARISMTYRGLLRK